MTSRTTGRLAPTPSGLLHLGNATAFYAAARSVRENDGQLLLRMEDVDIGRARIDVEAAQRADLQWLGLHWDKETRRQSERDYTPWLERLKDRVYYCQCTRKMVREAGGIYPGTCRELGHRDGAVRFRLPNESKTIIDRNHGRLTVDLSESSDPVLRRRDGVWAYNLAVVADDIEDGVTEVIRGADLLELTGVQAAIWEALGSAPPHWAHTPLILGDDGEKLSKTHGSLHLGALREAGWRPEALLDLIEEWLQRPTETVHLRLPENRRCPTPKEGLDWQFSGGD